MKIKGFEVTKERLELLREVLLRTRNNVQGGWMGYRGNGKWDFVSMGLPQVTPEEFNELLALVGIEPDGVESLGSCKDCKYSVNGRERGYSMPCARCLRPRHDLFELTEQEGVRRK
ncbi:MAG: hypothetical protein KKD77_21730 [Gammaproteobacteria bacterium]|nr:hypothetical protein [Gammaproteobacteria bacterium]